MTDQDVLDSMAREAMGAIFVQNYPVNNGQVYDSIARTAYRMASAMMTERARQVELAKTAAPTVDVPYIPQSPARVRAEQVSVTIFVERLVGQAWEHVGHKEMPETDRKIMNSLGIKAGEKCELRINDTQWRFTGLK